MSYYRIANLIMHVQCENKKDCTRVYSYHDCAILPRCLGGYEIEKEEKVDIDVIMSEIESVELPEKYKQVYNQVSYGENGNHRLVFLDIHDRMKPGYSLLMSKNYNHTYYIPHKSEYNVYDLQLIQFVFENVILNHGGVVLHGAAIEHKGKGIIFSGVSGAGKSTQAHLWKRYRDAIVINGDCPAVRIENEQAFVYGTPWCGTSGESIDRKVPLTDIVLVHKASYNKIKELQGKEVLLSVLAFVLKSNFDTSRLPLAISNLNAILPKVRVIEFYCTKGIEAVEALEAVIQE